MPNIPWDAAKHQQTDESYALLHMLNSYATSHVCYCLQQSTPLTSTVVYSSTVCHCLLLSRLFLSATLLSTTVY